MDLVDYLGNWLWLFVVGGIMVVMALAVPLFDTKKERQQNAEAQQAAQDHALARAVQLRSRDDVRVLLRDGARRLEAAGQADGRSRHPARTGQTLGGAQ